MAAYLEQHPPASPQYRKPRREDPSGIIEIHSAENTPDFVAFDGGAEAVANFIATRMNPGSYHDLVDSDSILDVVPYEWEAFHDATGMNPHALSISAATRADVWPLAPKRWRDGVIENMARAAVRQARWIKAKTGIVVPATRITREESEARVPGFISHAQRDPTRRTDPGKDFPWSDFLARYAQLMGITEELSMADAAEILARIDKYDDRNRKRHEDAMEAIAEVAKAIGDDTTSGTVQRRLNVLVQKLINQPSED